jgi:DNA-binding MarR family transcriptional regulator
VVHVGITGKGKRALESLRCDERDVLGDVYDRLPPGDRPRVLEALERIRACLDESSRGEAGSGPLVSIRKSAP